MNLLLRLGALFFLLLFGTLVLNIVLSIYKYEEGLAGFQKDQISASLGTLNIVIYENVYEGLPLRKVQNIAKVIEDIERNEAAIYVINVFDSQGHILFSSDSDNIGQQVGKLALNMAFFSQSEDGQVLKEGNNYFYYKRIALNGKIFGGYQVGYFDAYSSLVSFVWSLTNMYLLPWLIIFIVAVIVFFSWVLFCGLRVLRRIGDAVTDVQNVMDDEDLSQMLDSFDENE